MKIWGYTVHSNKLDASRFHKLMLTELASYQTESIMIETQLYNSLWKLNFLIS